MHRDLGRSKKGSKWFLDEINNARETGEDILTRRREDVENRLRKLDLERMGLIARTQKVESEISEANLEIIQIDEGRKEG